MPKISLCQLSMVDTDFAGDVEIAKELSIDGLGLIELKVADGDIQSLARQLEDASLQATVCATNVLTILPRPPDPSARFAGPAELDARLESMAQGIRRLAPMHPDTVFFVTGPAGEYPPKRAREAVIDALRSLWPVAQECGTRLAVEPMREDSL